MSDETTQPPPDLRLHRGDAAPSLADAVRRMQSRLDTLLRDADELRADMRTVAEQAAAAERAPATRRALLSLEEAAELLGIGLSSLRVLVDGERDRTGSVVRPPVLETRRIGRRRLVPRGALETFVGDSSARVGGSGA